MISDVYDEAGARQRRQEIERRKAEVNAVNRVNCCQKPDLETGEPIVVGGLWECPGVVS